MSAPSIPVTRRTAFTLCLVAIVVSTALSLAGAAWLFAPRASRVVDRLGEGRVAFAPTLAALQEYVNFKRDAGLTFLKPETRVVLRDRGPIGAFVEVRSGEQRGRLGFVDSALVAD